MKTSERIQQLTGQPAPIKTVPSAEPANTSSSSHHPSPTQNKYSVQKPPTFSPPAETVYPQQTNATQPSQPPAENLNTPSTVSPPEPQPSTSEKTFIVPTPPPNPSPAKPTVILQPEEQVQSLNTNMAVKIEESFKTHYLNTHRYNATANQATVQLNPTTTLFDSGLLANNNKIYAMYNQQTYQLTLNPPTHLIPDYHPLPLPSTTDFKNLQPTPPQITQQLQHLFPEIPDKNLLALILRAAIQETLTLTIRNPLLALPAVETPSLEQTPTLLLPLYLPGPQPTHFLQVDPKIQTILNILTIEQGCKISRPYGSAHLLTYMSPLPF